MQTKKKGNWNIATKPVTGKTVYLAFPGMGKTTYALHHAGVVDLDFGTFRSALGVQPKMQATLFGSFIKLINAYVKGGFTVLSNDPGLLPYLKSSGYKVVVELPNDVDDLVARVLKRGSNPAFDKMLAINAREWISNWDQQARRYGAQVIYQKYFSIGGTNDEHENPIN